MFFDKHIIATCHDDRHAVFAGQRAVDAGFAQFKLVEVHAGKCKAVNGVRQNAATLGARMVADHADCVHPIVHARHHAQVARLAHDGLGTRVQHIGRHIAKAAV